MRTGLRRGPVWSIVLVLACVHGLSLSTSLAKQPRLSLQEDPQELAAQAEEAQGKRDYRTAARMYQEMLKAEPHSAEVRANLGLMHHLLGEYTTAIQEFHIALQENPRLFVPNFFLGLDLLKTQKPHEAIPYLERAHNLNPYDENAALSLGRAYSKVGDLAKARMSYNEAVRLNPKNARAWFHLGSSYLDLEDDGVERLGKAHFTSAYFQALAAKSFVQEGRLNDAIARYRQALEAQIAPPCVRSELGFVLIQSGQLEDAERELGNELRESPRCLMARLGLAHLALDRGDTTVAMDELSKIWRVDPDFLSANAPNVWQGLSTDKTKGLQVTLDEAQRGEGVRPALSAALAKWHERPIETVADISTNFLAEFDQPVPDGGPQRTSQMRVAQFYLEGKYAACRQSLRPLLPRLSLRDSLLLAECAYDSGDFLTSFVASQRAVDTDVQSPAAWYWRIKASEVLAVNALFQAGLMDPDSAEVHVMLGDVYRARERYNEAEAEYRKAQVLRPEDTGALFGLCVTLLEDSDADEALILAQAGLEKSPYDPEMNAIMGEILSFRRQFSEAEPYLKKGLNAKPELVAHVHALLGKVYAETNRLPEAIEELKMALPDDQDGRIHYQLGRLYLKLGDRTAAKQAFAVAQRKQRERLTRATTAREQEEAELNSQ